MYCNTAPREVVSSMIIGRLSVITATYNYGLKLLVNSVQEMVYSKLQPYGQASLAIGKN